MQQHGSKYFARRPPPRRTLVCAINRLKFKFSKHGHVACQFKGNYESINIVTHILSQTPPKVNLGVGGKGFMFSDL